VRRVTIADLKQLAASALQANGANERMAATAAKYLVAADQQGLETHGVARVPTYCGHLRTGRARGDAVPRVVRHNVAACLVDGGNGLGFGPCELAVAEAMRRAPKYGIALAGVTNSHHCGALAPLLAPAAEKGLVALAFSNAAAAIAPAGGKRALFGTNPVAAVFPRAGKTPIVIDLSLTQVTRGQIMLLEREGKPIPEGWGMDKNGEPTTDAREILLGGSLHAIGGIKGTMLALTVELMCCALTGASLSHEVQSMHTEDGPPLRLGQTFIAIDPAALATREVYEAQVETLVSAMLEEQGVRLPGERRRSRADEAERNGIALSEDLYAELSRLATAGAVTS
jgi:(2R)-3-sulfolactate dehydrogenase (NADP+)